MLSNCKIRGNPEKSMKASKTRHLNHINHVRHAVDLMQVRNTRHEDTQYTRGIKARKTWSGQVIYQTPYTPSL